MFDVWRWNIDCIRCLGGYYVFILGVVYLLRVMYWCFYNLKYIYICSELMYVVININLGI